MAVICHFSDLRDGRLSLPSLRLSLCNPMSEIWHFFSSMNVNFRCGGKCGNLVPSTLTFSLVMSWRMSDLKLTPFADPQCDRNLSVFCKSNFSPLNSSHLQNLTSINAVDRHCEKHSAIERVPLYASYEHEKYTPWQYYLHKQASGDRLLPLCHRCPHGHTYRYCPCT